jgi:hypothetical protein
MAASAKDKNLSVATSVTPADAEPFEIPEEPKLPHCPVCQQGFLYVIAADPDATHENQPATREGNPTGHSHFVASGGSIRLMCFNCGTPQTQPMNADPDALAAANTAAQSEADQEHRTSGAR